MTSTRPRRDERFAFGENWISFAQLVDEQRIASAVASLTDALPCPVLKGHNFLDIGCGSGLFSLAAHRLGAEVHSFDHDASSVSAARELRARFAPCSDWTIERGSVLDEDYLSTLGSFDVVYAWGVLHHTGNMWHALEAAAGRVAPGGALFISIYNDQGFESRVWTRVKRRYNQSGPLLRRALVIASFLYLNRRRALQSAVRVIPGQRAEGTPRPTRARGMSFRHDLVDWVGGYPFEVAKPEQVFSRVHGLGFDLRRLTTCAGSIGCNEYVFERRTGQW